MMTRKQVMEMFFKLQKKYTKSNTITNLQVYQSEEKDWPVTLSVTQFEGTELMWTERIEWSHWTYHRFEDELENLAKVDEFERKMEEK